MRSKQGVCLEAFMAAVTFVGLLGCSDVSKQLAVGEVTYGFPAEEVLRFTSPGDGQPYARLRPQGQSFDLIYSSRASTRRNWQGDQAPLVTSINDHPSPRFSRHQSELVTVVCRDGGLHFGCGIQVNDQGVSWSVVFDKEEIAQADAIRTAALEVLKRYRGSRLNPG